MPVRQTTALKLSLAPPNFEKSRLEILAAASILGRWKHDYSPLVALIFSS